MNDVKIIFSEEYYQRIIWDLKDEINTHLQTICNQKKYIDKLEKEIREYESQLNVNPDACMPQYY